MIAERLSCTDTLRAVVKAAEAYRQRHGQYPVHAGLDADHFDLSLGPDLRFVGEGDLREHQIQLHRTEGYGPRVIMLREADDAETWRLFTINR